MRNRPAITRLLLIPLLCGCQSDGHRLKEHIDTVQITITLEPFDTYRPGQKDPGGGLRSVLVYSSNGLRIEPHARWTDGSPLSADAKLTVQEMLGVIDELERSAPLKNAEHFYSEAVANPKSRPPAGKHRHEFKAVRPSCIIEATYPSEGYHRYLICTVPWGKDSLTILKRLNRKVPGSLIQSLIRTCERFQ